MKFIPPHVKAFDPYRKKFQAVKFRKPLLFGILFHGFGFGKDALKQTYPIAEGSKLRFQQSSKALIANTV
uniref:Uncharacterized protein n=1 Tax=Romanomermis culicivorax TaxID=13658 RepID=A0A915HLF5_ROMCU